VVRAANTGISAFILPGGQIVEQSGLFTETLLTQELPLPGPGLTVYTRYGDFFAIALTIISAVNIFVAYCYTRKKSRRR
jgi:apolipoprotein N-acyltransferase